MSRSAGPLEHFLLQAGPGRRPQVPQLRAARGSHRRTSRELRGAPALACRSAQVRAARRPRSWPAASGPGEALARAGPRPAPPSGDPGSERLLSCRVSRGARDTRSPPTGRTEPSPLGWATRTGSAWGHGPGDTPLPPGPSEGGTCWASSHVSPGCMF